MEIVDPPPFTEFDTSPFVTYQSEELTTPTAAELVEELPEWSGREAMEKQQEEAALKPRRGVGFLRAEVPPDEDGEEEAITDDFGDGLDFGDASVTEAVEAPAKENESSIDIVQSNAEVPEAATSAIESASESTSDRSARKRRRRRPRRRKKQNGSSHMAGGNEGSATTETELAGETDNSSQNIEKLDSKSDQPDEKAANSGSRRRRRRRRGRRRKSGGDGDSGPASISGG